MKRRGRRNIREGTPCGGEGDVAATRQPKVALACCLSQGQKPCTIASARLWRRAAGRHHRRGSRGWQREGTLLIKGRNGRKTAQT